MKGDQSITAILNSGDLDQLLPLVYGQLQRIAHEVRKRENPALTWVTTELVNEWYLKLKRSEAPLSVENRRHLYNAAALGMRRLLCDHARKRRRAKRGARLSRIPLDDILDMADNKGVDIISLTDALERLQVVLPRAHEVFQLVQFAGLSTKAISELMDVSIRTIQEDLTLAKAWLRKEMEGHNVRVESK